MGPENRLWELEVPSGHIKAGGIFTKLGGPRLGESSCS